MEFLVDLPEVPSDSKHNFRKIAPIKMDDSRNDKLDTEEIISENSDDILNKNLK